MAKFKTKAQFTKEIKAAITEKEGIALDGIVIEWSQFVRQTHSRTKRVEKVGKFKLTAPGFKPTTCLFFGQLNGTWRTS